MGYGSVLVRCDLNQFGSIMCWLLQVYKCMYYDELSWVDTRWPSDAHVLLGEVKMCIFSRKQVFRSIFQTAEHTRYPVPTDELKRVKGVKHYSVGTLYIGLIQWFQLDADFTFMSYRICPCHVIALHSYQAQLREYDHHNMAADIAIHYKVLNE